MKNLFVLAALAMGLSCMIPGANAEIVPETGMTTNFTPVNISITILTNGVDTDTSNSTSQVVGMAKIDNNTLLNIFAHWAGTNKWPAGTKLVIGWDFPWYGDVLVVDNKGTNVLYNADYGRTNYFYVEYENESGPVANKYVETASGSDYTDMHDSGGFGLYDAGLYLKSTDIFGTGNTLVSITQNFNNEGFTTWRMTADLKSGEGCQVDEYWLDEANCEVSGSINSSGSGKGQNHYLPY
jgi:hypothetical protein